jgi:hypothetical protein
VNLDCSEEEAVAEKTFQILPLTRLKRTAGRIVLGQVEHTGVHFIITEYGAAVAELGPLSSSAKMFMTHPSGDEEDSSRALKLGS